MSIRAVCLSLLSNLQALSNGVMTINATTVISYIRFGYSHVYIRLASVTQSSRRLDLHVHRLRARELVVA